MQNKPQEGRPAAASPCTRCQQGTHTHCGGWSSQGGDGPCPCAKAGHRTPRAATPTSRGDRVELVSTTDPHTTLKPGTLGTVAFIDSLGTVHVQWDNGASLGLVPGEDRYRTLG